MKTFLQQLFTTGAVTVPLPGQAFDSAADAGLEIGAFDEAARWDFPGEAPRLEQAVAGWAALRIAEIARLIIARELDEADIAAVFAVQCPAAASPETDYSADLFFRYLPGLAEVIERLSPGDPLLVRVNEFGAGWPLSSVGMKHGAACVPGRVDIFATHAGLRQLYADRILASADVSRVGHRGVDAALRTALGAHPELCPGIAEALGTTAVIKAGSELEIAPNPRPPF